MINKLIEFIEDSIISLRKEGVEPNAIFLGWEDRKLLEKYDKDNKYIRPACELEYPTLSSRNQLLGLDVFYIDGEHTCVCKRANVKYFKRSFYEPNN